MTFWMAERVQATSFDFQIRSEGDFRGTDSRLTS